MIDLPLYAAFSSAVLLLMLTPGPTVAVITANAVAHGTRYGLLTVAALMSEWFEVLRWIGVAYLVGLGVLAWRAPPDDLAAIGPQRCSPRRIFLGGFVVSITNPKTLLFLGAFFPQFIDAGRPVGPQIALLAVTYFVIGSVVDSVWALLAGRLRFLLARSARVRNRITGALMIGAGAGLAMVRRS